MNSLGHYIGSTYIDVFCSFEIWTADRKSNKQILFHRHWHFEQKQLNSHQVCIYLHGLRPKNTNMPKNKVVGRSEILFIFWSSFYMLISGRNCFLWLSFQHNYYKKVNRKVQEEQQAEAAANPRHQEEEKKCA